MNNVIWNIYTPFSSHGIFEEQTLVKTSSGSVDIQSWTNTSVSSMTDNNMIIFTVGRFEYQSRSLVIAIFAEGICTLKNELELRYTGRLTFRRSTRLIMDDG